MIWSLPKINQLIVHLFNLTLVRIEYTKENRQNIPGCTKSTRKQMLPYLVYLVWKCSKLLWLVWKFQLLVWPQLENCWALKVGYYVKLLCVPRGLHLAHSFFLTLLSEHSNLNCTQPFAHLSWVHFVVTTV